MRGKRYLNVKSKNVIEVFNQGAATVSIATVTDTGYGRKRQANADSFHDHYLDREGRPHTAGYVPVNSLPGDHPRAMKTEMTRMEILESIEYLTNQELADLILEQQRIEKEAKAVIAEAKRVVKARRKDPGTELHGDTVMVFSPDRKFNAQLAVQVLTSHQLAMISVPKPDATLAKRVFGEDSELFRKCQKDEGLKLTVREATDQDRLVELAMATPGSFDAAFTSSAANLDESFELTVE